MTVIQSAAPLALTAEDRTTLQCFAKSQTMAHRTVLRARALLLAHEGVADYEIARRVGVNANSVRTWRQRFEDEGLESVGRIAPGRVANPHWPRARSLRWCASR
jgi:transposase-like protein